VITLDISTIIGIRRIYKTSDYFNKHGENTDSQLYNVSPLTLLSLMGAGTIFEEGGQEMIRRGSADFFTFAPPTFQVFPP